MNPDLFSTTQEFYKVDQIAQMPYFPAKYDDETPESFMFNNPIFGCKVIKFIASADTEIYSLPCDKFMQFASYRSKFVNLDEKLLK